jgi:hypothetical protein
MSTLTAEKVAPKKSVAKKSVAKKVAPKKVVKISEYTKNVIHTNRALKTEYKTLGGCVKQLLFFKKEMGLSKSYITILNGINKDSAIYKQFAKSVRSSKSGNYAPFFVLQAIHKSIQVAKKTK